MIWLLYFKLWPTCQSPVVTNYQFILKNINPFNPEFTTVIFTHYKTRIAAAILVVDEDDLMWFEN